MRFIIFRHAQSTDNAAHTFSGKRDPDLTDKGLEEAREIQEKLKSENVTKAFSSDKKRCKETLEIVLKSHPQAKIQIDGRINERDYGDLTGKNKDDVEREFPDKYPLWHRSYDVAPPNGESIKDIEPRIWSFLNDTKAEANPSDVILICASANAIRPMRKYFENLSSEEMMGYEYTPAQIFEYKV